MNAESIATLARLLGTLAGVVVASSAIAVWIRRRRVDSALWTVAAGIALGCATWLHAGSARESGDGWVAVAAAWLVPALVTAVAARYWRIASVCVGIAGAAVAVLAQPFWDPDCVGACHPQDALLTADPRLATIGGLVVAAAGIVLAAANAKSSPLAVVAAGAWMFWAIDAAIPLPRAPGAAVAVVLAVAGIVSGIWSWPPAIRSARGRAGLRRLAEPVTTLSDRGQVERMLGEAVGDRTVRLALPGEPIGRNATSIMRDDELVATIESARPLDPHRIASALTPAVRIGIDDARLRQDIAARIEELEASRTRLLETSDRERRRLERNVHDGTQQYLIAALAQLGLAREDPVETATGVHDALERLRTLTRGVGSPVLDSAGLGPALAALADRVEARLAFSGDLEIDGRSARNVYTIVADAAAAADRIGVPLLTVDVARAAESILLRLAPADAVAGRIGNRVAALGGTESRGADDTWEVTLPCA